jgi:nicotinamidase-related amidase
LIIKEFKMKKTLIALLLGLSCAATPLASLAQPTANTAARQVGYVQPLTAENSLLLMVDLQDMFGMTISSIDQTNLVNNATGIAKAAKVFNVPTILASANAKSFAGPFFQQVTQARPDLKVYDRTAINVWQDPRVVEQIKQSGRKKIIIGGLWTASCVMLPALSALGEGYEVYILSDVTGDITADTQHNAMQRLIQAGATPVNWVALMLEWQQDWSHKNTAGGVLKIASEHGASWGMGANYAGAMNVGSEAK